MALTATYVYTKLIFLNYKYLQHSASKNRGNIVEYLIPREEVATAFSMEFVMPPFKTSGRSSIPTS